MLADAELLHPRRATGEAAREHGMPDARHPSTVPARPPPLRGSLRGRIGRSQKRAFPIRHERAATLSTSNDAPVKVTQGKVYVLDLAGMRAVVVPAGRRDVARPR